MSQQPINQLPSTHVDAVRAVLDFVRARYSGRLLIAEGSALSHTQEGFERFGYRSLIERYDVELIDLNADQTVTVEVYDRKLRRRPLRLARTVVESDFRISLGSAQRNSPPSAKPLSATGLPRGDTRPSLAPNSMP